jgi:hypothetical protein
MDAFPGIFDTSVELFSPRERLFAMRLENSSSQTGLCREVMVDARLFNLHRFSNVGS